MTKNRHSEIQEKIENRDRIHVVMTFLTLVFIGLSVVIIGCIIHIQTSYKVDPKVINIFRPRENKYVEEPKRGRILAEDGRPLAITTPLYDIFIDCTVHIIKFSVIAPDRVPLQEVLAELDLQNLPFLKPSWGIRILKRSLTFSFLRLLPLHPCRLAFPDKLLKLLQALRGNVCYTFSQMSPPSSTCHS